MTAQELYQAGIIEKVIPEVYETEQEESLNERVDREVRTAGKNQTQDSKQAEYRDMDMLAENLKTHILEFLERYKEKSPETIVEERYQRFRSI